ncbi:oligosaccharide flippase family protein, partial [Agrobacterium pusense]
MFGASMMNTAAGLASLIAGFGSSIIVARVLGVNGSGIVAYALWIMTAATLVSDLGLPQALLRFAAKGSDSERIALLRALTRRFALSTGLLATVMAGFAMWRYSTGSPATAWVWMATAGLFLCYAYSTLSLGVAQGLGHFRQTSVNTVAGCLIQPVSVAVGAVFLGPAGAILGQMVRHLPQALGLRRYFAFEAAPADYSVPSAVNTYARNNWMSGGLAALLSSRVELAVIGAYLGVTE